MLLEPMEGVGYVVSMQYTDSRFLQDIPDSLKSREDVKVITLEGRGLARNRNHALDVATADILLIADDDERISANALRQVMQAYADHPEVDIALFRLNDIHDRPFKIYPDGMVMDYAEACEQGYYPSSLEISMRGKLAAEGLRFNERFGLGAEFPCGEEDVLLCDAGRRGCQILLFDVVVAQTIAGSTGSKFLVNPGVQQAKGAVFRYCFGKWGALWRITKEALYYLIHQGRNPFPLFHHMMQGIRAVEKS